MKHLKSYSVWVAILSYISIVVVAIIKLKRNIPSDAEFVSIMWGLIIMCFISVIFMLKEK